ncbi:helix-turn-helix transcriptional regulator [Enterococcus faecalis]|uniref:helix-turn-helix domain-containing protein n=1 Tax=Enterococcus TaxID=1350 RepID=UPI0003534D8B|nr:helix-turn-helix transcriptional regulator [Enterococcus faecalis]EGO8924086.1 XRE family transcriptional regulator [Enterococcus faecalis]EGQ7429809.1 helix-turn-helix transcriptional regulator [Enterococcus faecalis]ELY8211383.1 helix-turn-helix transcriptional regulator [Enterococcus faecalis]EPH97012.1 DNA-binding helix-turn-helix protein [Enterococcus faecalis F01966]KXF69560.1 Cro/Cl family transcriptional regulator [Enterococcus faecalis]
MNTYEIIKDLAKEKGLSIRQLEINFGYSNGYIGSWKRQTPNSNELSRIADYFDVSVDYLLGRTEKKKYYDLTDKDERSIQKQLQSLIDDLSNDGALAFSKEDGEMSEETKEALISSLENALRISKIEAKKKYTPKKYRS